MRDNESDLLWLSSQDLRESKKNAIEGLQRISTFTFWVQCFQLMYIAGIALGFGLTVIYGDASFNPVFVYLFGLSFAFFFLNQLEELTPEAYALEEYKPELSLEFRSLKQSRLRRSFIGPGNLAAFMMLEGQGMMLPAIAVGLITVCTMVSFFISYSSAYDLRSRLLKLAGANEYECAKLLPLMQYDEIKAFRNRVVSMERRFTQGEVDFLLARGEAQNKEDLKRKAQESCLAVYVDGMKA